MQRKQSEKIVSERNRKRSILLSQSQDSTKSDSDDEDEEDMLEREDIKEAFNELVKGKLGSG